MKIYIGNQDEWDKSIFSDKCNYTFAAIKFDNDSFLVIKNRYGNNGMFVGNKKLMKLIKKTIKHYEV